MKLIIGIGNHLPWFKNTHHNIGHMFIDYITNQNIKTNTIIKTPYSKIYPTERFIYIKNRTSINNSYRSIVECKKTYNTDNKNIYILYDDFSLNLGEFKIRTRDSTSNHNGIKPVYEKIGNGFTRILIGTNKPGSKPNARRVLFKFTQSEKNELLKVFKGIALQFK